MAIRRKDGSIYKVSGPNKLMITQNHWNEDEEFVLHNFDRSVESTFEQPKEIVVPQKIELIVPELKPTASPSTVIHLEPPKPIEPTNTLDDFPDQIILTKPTQQPKSESIDPSKTSKYRKGQRSLIYCLPAEKRERIDELYGEKSFYIAYNDPFKFAAVVIESNDISFYIWTTVKHVTKSSILFCSEDRRWWKVQNIQDEETHDGFILTCRPSELKPNFDSV